MLKKTSILTALLIITATLSVVSCGSSSSGGGKSPEVDVVTDGNSGGNSSEGANSVLVIQTENGTLAVNGENISPSSYSNQGAIIINDENGNSCEYAIDSTNGNVTVYPADGTVAGTYTVTITADGREYVLIIAVSADGTAVVNTAISYPSGSGMVLDLDSGKVFADVTGDGTEDSLTLSSLTGTSYTLDSSVISIVVKDNSGNTVTVSVDPVTGDLITGSGTGPYSITIVKTEGTITTTYSIRADSNGKIISIGVDGVSHVLIPAMNGTAVIVPSATISGVTIGASIPVSEKISGVWTMSGDIQSITASIAGESVDVKIDPLTGSIISSILTLAETKVVIVESTDNSIATHTILINAEGKVISYTKSEIYKDGTTVITIILLDENGNIKVFEEKIVKPNGETTITTVVVNSDGTSSLTVTNAGVMLRLGSGSVSSNGYVLSVTEISGGLWTLKSGVEIISGMAADGSISIDTSKITVDSVTGYLLINGDGIIVPAGPYEIKVRINGSIYIIKSDENGNVETIIPGNILLQAAQGYMTYSDRDVLKITGKNGTVWSLSSQITLLTAVDDSGNSVDVSTDPYKGNFVTSGNITGPVTLTFIYTDSAQNQITYTVVVINGSVTSYTAEITNPGPDFDFSTVTNIKIYLNVVDNKTGLPIGQASINLLKTNGGTGSDDNWKGFTDSNGISVFAATVENASKTTEILVSKTGYEEFRCSVDGIGKLIEYARKIALNPVEAVVVKDSDGDGVADEDDAYPDDPAGAKSITGVYTLAFEDLYPSKGDADFNDLVVRLTIIEKIDSQNMLRQIDLKTKLLASGAGYSNQFAINIDGRKYILIADPKEDGIYTLGTSSNTSGTYRDCEEKTHDPIVFSSGITRESIGTMPYDPFIICDGVAGNEVHLPSAATSFEGITKDSSGFPWVLIVPETWAWPREGSGRSWDWNYRIIYKAYPQFDDWYTSAGVYFKDWYSNPDAGTRYIYQR